MGSAACLAAATAARAQENDPLQELMQRNQQEESGAGFDAAANSARMPTASLPTLSPATTQTTEAAVAQYEQIVARGGWPQVPPANRLRLGIGLVCLGCCWGSQARANRQRRASASFLRSPR